MTPLRELLAIFGIEVDDSQIKRADKTIGGLIGTIKNFAGVVAGSFIARGIARMIGSTTQAADRIGEISTQIGVNAQALQAWSFAAQMAGVEQESLAQAFGILARNANAAARGSTEMRETFARLGVQTTDANGQLRAADAIMLDVADGLSRVESDAERTALSLQVLGRGGRQLLPLFKQGAAGIEAASKEFEELGGGFTDEDIAAADQYQDSIVKLNLALTKLKILFVREILPSIQRFVNWLIRTTKGVLASGRAVQLMKVALVALAGAAALMARSFVKLLLPFAPALAKIALLFLFVDDLITLFRGGKSVIGEFIDAVFGLGAAEKFVREVKFAFEGMLEVIKEIANGIAFITGQDPVFKTRARQPSLQEEIDIAREKERVKQFRAGQDVAGTATATSGNRVLLKPRIGPRFVSLPGTTPVPQDVKDLAARNITVNVNAPNADAKEVARKVVEEIDGRRRKELTATQAAIKPLAATP